jgi:Transposase DDE domain
MRRGIGRQGNFQHRLRGLFGVANLLATLRLPRRSSTGNIDQGHIVYYRASKSDCSRCLLKPKCTTAVARKITRDLNEDVRDRVRALANTEAFQQSRRERKKVEMRFAHMKRILRLDRFRLRGLSGVRDEVLLTATAQNLRRLAKLLCRAPPPLAAACPA